MISPYVVFGEIKDISHFCVVKNAQKCETINLKMYERRTRSRISPGQYNKTSHSQHLRRPDLSDCCMTQSIPYQKGVFTVRGGMTGWMEPSCHLLAR